MQLLHAITSVEARFQGFDNSTSSQARQMTVHVLDVLASQILYKIVTNMLVGVFSTTSALFQIIFFLFYPVLFFRNFCPVIFFPYFSPLYFFFPYHFPVFFQKSRCLKSNVLKYQLVVFIVHVVITQFKFLAEYPFKRHP